MSYLIPIKSSHALELFDLIYKSEVTNTLAWDGPNSLEEFQENLAKREELVAKGELHQFTIISPISKQLIGSASIRAEKNDKSADIGLWIGVPFQGKGIGTQVVIELLDYGFKKLKLDQMTANIFTENLASRKIFEKCGFTLLKIAPKPVTKRGKILKQLFFSINKSNSPPHLLKMKN